jgi:hypothetical protein
MKKIFLKLYFSMVVTMALLLPVLGCTVEDAAGGVVGIIAAPFITFGICVATIAALVGLGLFIFWIIALVDCARRKPDEFPPGMDGSNAKTMWLIILIVTFFITQLNGIAAIIYYFMVMRKAPRKDS